MPITTTPQQAGGTPSAPLYIDQLEVTFVAVTDDYPAGGFALNFAALAAGAVGRVPNFSGRTILAVLAEGRVTATRVWDRVAWQFQLGVAATPENGILRGFLAGPRNATVAWVPGQAPAVRNDTVANLAADVVAAGTEIPTGSVMATATVRLSIFSH